MEEIQLERGVWSYAPESPLGKPGGFGAVFVGRDSEGGEVAVKKLHLDAEGAGHREMRIAAALVDRPLEHVMPVLDAGIDATTGSYFVVMPRAELSLQDELDRRNLFSDQDAASVLADIANGLAEVREITHRDLKPANILRFQNAWRIADFGIARFVEEATSARTLRDCLSPQYAAPEQWRSERATSATDIYALGCIAFCLLVGSPPFCGTTSELSEAHQRREPPSLAGHVPKLQSLVQMMLRKVSETRPSLDRVRQLVSEIASAPPDAPARRSDASFVMAGAQVAERYSKAQAELADEKQRAAARSDLGQQAFQILDQIKTKLFDHIRSTAPPARLVENGNGIALGNGTLVIKRIGGPYPPGAFPASGWDVVAGAMVAVGRNQPQWATSASLWYFRRDPNSAYRWQEVAYRTHALMRVRRQFEPYFLDDVREADLAAGAGMHTVEIDFGPVPIDDENDESFIVEVSNKVGIGHATDRCPADRCSNTEPASQV